MLKGNRVLYIAPSGQVFTALVKALNGLNPGFMTLVYVDPDAPENDNVKTAFDVPHMSDSSKDENNPDLPRYVLNCWKEVHEYHKELPADHPNFDHPSAKFEENAEVREAVAKAGGKPIVAERPLYAAHIDEHQAIQAEVKKAEAEAEPDPNIHTAAQNVDNPVPVPVTPDPNIATAASEQLPPMEVAPVEAVATPEPDVTAQLDAAGPAPVVEEKKPEDAA